MSATGRCMHRQNVYEHIKTALVWCFVTQWHPQDVSLGVYAKAGLRVGAKLPIATEAGPLEETVCTAASAPPAGNSKLGFLPFFLHPRTILKDYPDLEGMVILSFTFITFNCFWGVWIPLLLHFSLWGTKAKITFFAWIFFQAQM